MSTLPKKLELENHADEAKLRPEIYADKVRNVDGKEISVQQAAESVECGVILERVGRWALTEFGIECLAVYYPIVADRIYEDDWLRQLKEKTWFTENDEDDFLLIWDKAKAKWPAKSN